MGWAVGIAVGWAVGDAVVGAAVGMAVGWAVGDAVGWAVATQQFVSKVALLNVVAQVGFGVPVGRTWLHSVVPW